MNIDKTIRNLKSKGVQIKVVHYRYLNQDIEKIKKFEQRLSHGVKLTSKEQEALAEIFDFKLYPTSTILPKNASPRGGRTEVQLTFSDGSSAFGESHAVLSDNYEKSRGVSIALGRALKKCRT